MANFVIGLNPVPQLQNSLQFNPQFIFAGLPVPIYQNVHGNFLANASNSFTPLSSNSLHINQDLNPTQIEAQRSKSKTVWTP